MSNRDIAGVVVRLDVKVKPWEIARGIAIASEALRSAGYELQPVPVEWGKRSWFRIRRNRNQGKESR